MCIIVPDVPHYTRSANLNVYRRIISIRNIYSYALDLFVRDNRFEME